MAKTNPDTVILEGDADRKNDAQATSGIDPGELIERQSVDTTGAKDTFGVAPHQTDDAVTSPMVALEYAKAGRGITDAYSVDDHVEYKTAKDGEEYFMILAGGENLGTSANANVSAGDSLGSAGNGRLRGSVTAGNEMFEALETVSNANTTSGQRIRVERI